MEKIFIIGGMAAGCKAAARLKRLMPESSVTIIEKRPFVSYGACGMPLFASGDVDGFFDLAKTTWGVVRDAKFFNDVKGVEVRTETEVTAIDRENRTINIKGLKSGEETTERYDKLIISTGARPLKAPFECPEHENISSFHNPLDAKKFRQKAQTGQVGSAIIVGGGFIGVELAEAMVSLWGIETTLIELQDSLLPRSISKGISTFLEKALEAEDIRVMTSTKVVKAAVNDDDMPVVKLENGEEISADYMFVCTGVEPVTELVKACGIETGKQNGIIVDKFMRTNDPDIYAGGDCCEVPNLVSGVAEIMPLGSLANRQGRVIANNIAGRESQFKGAAGAISLKVFGLTIAATGLNLAGAKALGINAEAMNANFYDRPEYHPEHKNLNATVVYEKDTLQLLGLQLAGCGELTRYIDQFTLMLKNKADAYDLIDAEHAYTPTHSSPVSPLNNIGAMIINTDVDDIVAADYHVMPDLPGIFLDVREKAEAEAYPFGKECRMIQIEELRGRIGELPKDEQINIICQRGPRSYEAARLLKNSGFEKVVYLCGGMEFALAKPDVED